MAATSEIQKKNEESKLNVQLNEFIRKYRKGLLIGLIAIIAILAGLVVTVIVRDKIQAAALSKVDSLSRRYNELKEFSPHEDQLDVSRLGETTILVIELSEFTKKNSGFAAARAYGITADIHVDQKQWAEAEEAWTKAAKAAGKSYFAPIAYFNAAVAAEEQGNIEAAIDYYRLALEFESVFPSAARAQFSIGRLEEGRNNREAALEAYRTLLGKWPDDPVWSNLSQSRILLIQ
jgi:tetratricopeptide (TPR) repeat protein